MNNIDNDEFFNLMEELIADDQKKSSIHAYIPLEYIEDIQRSFMQGGKIICHPMNKPKYLMQRGEKFDWNNKFYERVLPKNNIKGSTKNGSNRRAGVYDSINCYPKD